MAEWLLLGRHKAVWILVRPGLATHAWELNLILGVRAQLAGSARCNSITTLLIEALKCTLTTSTIGRFLFQIGIRTCVAAELLRSERPECVG